MTLGKGLINTKLKMRIVLIYSLMKKVGGRGAGGDIVIHKEEIREHLRKKETLGLHNLPFDHRKQRRVVFHQPRMNTPVKTKRQNFIYTSWLIVVN